MATKTHVNVFVTKTFRFRAKIAVVPEKTVEDCIFDRCARTRRTEVTIGGDSWRNGKGQEYRSQIKDQMKRILFRLAGDYAVCDLDNKKYPRRMTIDFLEARVKVEGV